MGCPVCRSSWFGKNYSKFIHIMTRIQRIAILLAASLLALGPAPSCRSAQSDEKQAVMIAVRTLLLDQGCSLSVPGRLPIGARAVAATPADQGTVFAAPGGAADAACTLAAPCSIYTAFARLQPGDVLFLRGGIYDIPAALRPGSSGTADMPIIIESYPGETAVLTGHYAAPEDVAADPDARTNGIHLSHTISYIMVRKIEVQHMGWAGIAVYGSHNTVEGCYAHNNMVSGINLYGGEWHEDAEDYVIPYPYGYNLVTDNMVVANSDVGLDANGGNSDGIAISSGRCNIIVHNTVYGNSDDGIDTWRSNDTLVEFNLVHDNGLGDGDGNGIKAGGNLDPEATNGLRAVVRHNIVYDNRARGLDYNSGHEVVFQYNTSYHNGTVGVNGGEDTTVEYNIASENGSQDSQLGTNNSWNIQEHVNFVSTDPASPDFLKPLPGSPFVAMGAYAGLAND